MGKLFILCVFFIGISSVLSAQAYTMSNCAIAADTSLVPIPSHIPGIYPNDSFFPCIHKGVLFDDTLYFKNYHTLNYIGTPAALDSLTIDSIYLPTGICWQTNKLNNTFAPGENGVIRISGTSYDTAGQYKMGVYITAVTSLGTIQGSAEKYAGLVYKVKLIDTMPPCAWWCPVTDNATVDSARIFIPYDMCCDCWIGINEINDRLSNLSIVPNPFSNNAVLTFNSNRAGTYTITIVNLLGATVSSKDVYLKQGSNEIPIERNGLDAGVYMLSISDGSEAVNTKVIIE